MTTYPTSIWTRTTKHGPRPPEPVIHHGVSLGPSGGCIVSALWAPDRRVGVFDCETFPPSLRKVAARIVELLDEDPTCVIVVDGGLHGPDLKDYLKERQEPRSRLSYFDATRPEMRRAELGGRLRSAHERHEFGIKRIGAGSLALRAAVADAAREDAADRVAVVALSLAVVNRRRVPRIG